MYTRNRAERVHQRKEIGNRLPWWTWVVQHIQHYNQKSIQPFIRKMYAITLHRLEKALKAALVGVNTYLNVIDFFLPVCLIPGM